MNNKGLSQAEADQRLKKYGPNKIIFKKEKGVILKFLSKFANPLVIMLIIIAAVSIFLGQNIDASIIILMVALSVILSFVQEHNANQAADKLKAMVKITALIYRDGKKQEIPLNLIVPGDRIILNPGKMIPADLKIVSDDELYLNQSTLTGESFPVRKTADSTFKAPTIKSVYDNPELAFMGSSVVSGFGEAEVLKTGRNTEFGKLSGEILKTSSTTSFEKGIGDFSWLMIKFTFGLVLFIFVVNSLLKGNYLESLLFALAVAVGLTPEMLPMIVTVNLAKGALAMAKKKVIVKELRAIQNFGAMDVLCTDKTGTLTLNSVALIRHADPQGKESEPVLRLAYLNSRLQDGMDNLLDEAVVNHHHFEIKGFEKVGEIPFDFNRRLSSVAIKGDSKVELNTKGAPEEVLKKSTSYLVSGKVYDLTDEVREKITELYNQFSQDGFRTLAIGTRPIEEKQHYTLDDEKNLTFIGLIAFLDPPKPEAEPAISQLEQYGIKLKVLTGDNELVSQKICREVNIPIEAILSGAEIDRLNDQELSRVVETANLFVRINPMQKERVIKAMRLTHVVGYLGDGINDAPGLKAADVGISVDNATDIAKETAQIILLEKDLSILSGCVVEGRKTFANVIKYIKMGASSNFGNMLSMTGASVFLPFLPMLPGQILLNNLLYDSSQVAIPTDRVDEDYLKSPRPWNIDFIKKFMLYIGTIGSIFDFITFGVMWYVFHANETLFHTGWFVASLLEQILVVYIIRTNKIPFIQSSPSRALLLSTLAIVFLAIYLPFSPLANYLGFMSLPPLFFGILLLMIISYLFVTQIVKTWFIKKFGFE